MTVKPVKYLIIAGVNLIVLIGLLILWTDFVELVFNRWIRLVEFIKIIGVTLLAFIAMRIAVIFFRKRSIYSLKKRIGISVFLTFLVSSFLYVHYLKKVYQNRMENGAIRNELASKIERVKGLAFGTKADDLTYAEYQEITKVKWFPTLQKHADSISYCYIYDGFLPDYSLKISYSLPKEIEIDTTTFEYGSYRFSMSGNTKRVFYNEYVD